MPPFDAQGSLTCTLSGWAGQFALLSSFAWTCAYARVLRLVLTRAVPVARIWSLMPRLHLLAWGVPLLLSASPFLEKAADGHIPYQPIEYGAPQRGSNTHTRAPL